MTVNMAQLFDLMVEENASDVHITVGRPPVLRRRGRLQNVRHPVLEPGDTMRLVEEIAPERMLTEFREKGSADFGKAHGQRARFRCAIFRQRGHAALVARLIPNRLLTFDEIGLPQSVRDLCNRPRGLVLVTGPTGSGKTTTLATMLDDINTNHDVHIITVEDPIEYYHNHKKAIVNQREIGVDVPSFAEGLRRALRQDPDVILVGEMRDQETISTAITAAETGHLVFGTLHTTGSARTMDRIIDQFPPEQQEQIRVQLSVSIIAVISQVLMPTADGKGMVAAFEVMLMTSAVENHVRKAETFKIPSTIQTSKGRGMFLLDDHLLELARQGKISNDEACMKAQDPRILREKLGGSGKAEE
ncbi:MAG: type IV pilus twitching motility protein PilT [Planctomycetota bacterium]|nr:type IV pilus twitching motility protein PilT [Planctomycetota bacterium]